MRFVMEEQENKNTRNSSSVKERFDSWLGPILNRSVGSSDRPWLSWGFLLLVAVVIYAAVNLVRSILFFVN